MGTEYTVRYRAFLKARGKWKNNHEVMCFITEELELWADEEKVVCGRCGVVGKHLCKYPYRPQNENSISLFDDWLEKKYLNVETR